MEAQCQYKKNGVAKRNSLYENGVEVVVLLLLGGAAFFHVDSRLPPAAADEMRNRRVGQHGEKIAGGGKHEGKGIFFGGKIAKSGGGIAQEMHERSSQEDAARELRPQQKKTLVPSVEIRRHSAGECAHEHDYQAPNLHQNQPFRVQVPFVGCGRVAVVAAAVSCGLGKVEEEKRDGDEES